MPAHRFDIDALTTALDDAQPSGPALDEDLDFQALERAAAGTPERQYGDKVYPAEPPEWPAVLSQAATLAERSRDLRLACLMTRSAARLGGFCSASSGLQLIQALLERHWDTVHPQLDAEDGNDPTMRLNALLPLATADALLADLRSATLAPARGSLTLRELELGLGRDEPHPDEAQPTESGVLEALSALLKAHPEVAADIRAATAASQAIGALLDDKVGSRAPDLSPLQRLLRSASDALQRVQSSSGQDADAGGESASTGDDSAPASATGGGGSRGDIRTRSDALRELERVCIWLEKNEPSNPAPLLIRRAQRLMNMGFIDIIKDMASNGMDQVETVVGKPAEEI
jgi:type VI secretion system protein ImpA